jgi:integrase
MLWVTRRQKTWRYKSNRGRSTLSLGTFPELSLDQARALAAAMKIAPNPALARRIERVQAVEASERTLRFVAERWMEARGDKANWTPLVRLGIERRLETYVLRTLGDLPISALTTETVETLIKTVHRKYSRTAVALRQHLSGIFAYALRRDWCTTNLIQRIAEDLPTPKPHQHHRGVRTIEDARAVLRAVEARAQVVAPWTLLAHRLIALTAGRGGEIRGAKWSEFDLAAAVWTIPAERMKGKDGKRREHKVPLSPQAIEVIRAAERLRRNEYVFPSHRAKPSGHTGEPTLHSSTINRTIHKSLEQAGLGRIMVCHGWRRTFLTIIGERDFGDRAVADMMLAHKPIANSHAEPHYQFAQNEPARRRIAEQWADMLLDGAPTASTLVGLDAPASNVVQLVPQVGRRAA